MHVFLEYDFHLLTGLPFSLSYDRLIAEKVNKNERKNKSDIIQVAQAQDEKGFWKLIGGEPTNTISVRWLQEYKIKNVYVQV